MSAVRRLALLCAALLSFAVQTRAAESENEVIAAFKAGHAKNYGAIPCLRVESSMKVTDGPAKPADEKPQNPNAFLQGSRDVLTTSWRRLRYEMKAEPQGTLLTMTFDGDVWNTFVEGGELLHRARTPSLGGRPACDLREAGASDIKKGLLQQIAAEKATAAEMPNSADPTSRARLTTEGRPHPDYLFRHFYEFDPAKNFLPTKVAQVVNDELNFTIDVAYQTLQPNVYFPKEIVHRAWVDGMKYQANLDAEKCRSLRTITVTDVKILRPEDIADSLWTIPVADGVRLDDVTGLHNPDGTPTRAGLKAEQEE